MLSNQTLSYPSRMTSILMDGLAIIGSSFIIALFAPVAIPLPFTPIPLALQPQVVLVLATLLGSRRGALSVITYISQGLMGLPVFAGGAAGVAVLAGPRGGYLMGYVAAAYLTGWIMERAKERTMSRCFLAMAAGSLAIYACGMSFLAQFVGVVNSFLLGVLPFLIGDFLKTLLAVNGLKRIGFFK